MEKAPFDFAIEHYALGPATWYRVGGPARLALMPGTRDEAIAAHAWMLAQPERHIILGGASNVLIADEGFAGIVLFTTRLVKLDPLGKHRYQIEAGVPLARLVRDVMVEKNYEGPGALAGIPGTAGGAMCMNSGTANGTTCQFLESVEIATRSGVKQVAVEPSMYHYRGQDFCGPDDLLVRGIFRFTPSEQDQKAVFDHYIQRRSERQPQGFCCGSVFKNPPNDRAARLIEAAGLKGTRVGGAVVSPIHANFIMNEGGATCRDILDVIERCRREVREKFGVELKEEVRIIK